MGSWMWRTHDGGVHAQVHSSCQGCDLEAPRLTTLRVQSRSAKGNLAWWLQSWAREKTDRGPCLGASLKEEGPSGAAHCLQAGAGLRTPFPKAATAGLHLHRSFNPDRAARAEGHVGRPCSDLTPLLQEIGSRSMVSLLHLTTGCDLQ